MSNCKYAKKSFQDEILCMGTKEMDVCPCYGNPHSKTCYYPETHEIKAIWFYSDMMGPVDRNVPFCYKSWAATEAAVRAGETEIHTYQMGYLIEATRLMDLGYRIFIYDREGEFEITLGKCARTNREIRKGHNIFKMWVNGEFDV